MENIDTIVENWIVKHLTGEATSDEEQQLHEWIAKSKTNEELFHEFKKTLRLGQDHYKVTSSKSLNIDVNKEWNEFVANVSDKQPAKVISIEDNSSVNYSWMKVAAAIALVIGVGFILNHFVGSSGITKYQTAENTQEVTLPDGSKVTLNKNSTLSYLEDFGEVDRQVNLAGEAFFDVTKNQEKYFIISTEKAQVQVLGTSFNVRVNPHHEETEVVVATGKVKFSKNNTNESVILKSGDKGILNTKELVNKSNADVNFLSWKTGKITFENDSFDKAIQTLNKLYDVNISINVDIPESCDHLTVTFEQQSIESIINVLKSTFDLEVVIDGNNIEITSIEC